MKTNKNKKLNELLSFDVEELRQEFCISKSYEELKITRTKVKDKLMEIISMIDNQLPSHKTWH